MKATKLILLTPLFFFALGCGRSTRSITTESQTDNSGGLNTSIPASDFGPLRSNETPANYTQNINPSLRPSANANQILAQYGVIDTSYAAPYLNSLDAQQQQPNQNDIMLLLMLYRFLVSGAAPTTAPPGTVNQVTDTVVAVEAKFGAGSEKGTLYLDIKTGILHYRVVQSAYTSLTETVTLRLLLADGRSLNQTAQVSASNAAGTQLQGKWGQANQAVVGFNAGNIAPASIGLGPVSYGPTLFGVTWSYTKFAVNQNPALAIQWTLKP